VKFPNVADAVQIQEDCVQVVFLDGSSELIEGRLFGVWRGDWKLWLKTSKGILKVDPAEGPMTYPQEIRFRYDETERQRVGEISRLKRSDL